MIVHDRDGRVEPPGGVGRGRETEPPGSGGNVSGLGVDKLIGCRGGGGGGVLKN